MTKVVRQIDAGGGATRWTITITDIPSSLSQRRARQHAFLMEVVGDGAYSGLLMCGPIPFERLKMWHNGTAWIIEMEATENPQVLI